MRHAETGRDASILTISERNIHSSTEVDNSLPIAALMELLGSDKQAGLSAEVSAARLERDGANQFDKSEGVNAFGLLLEQFRSSVVILLVVATIISLAMKEYLQATGIVAALIINAAIGFFTEYRAKVSLAALSKMAGAVVRVRRDGRESELPVTQLVCGDIVLLESGTRVPADLRIIESASFSIDESPLTGESVPVWKGAESDQVEDHFAYQGTSVVSGRAIALVVATGGRTKMGRLGALLQEVSLTETPLTKSLDTLGQQLTLLVMALCVFFILLGAWRHTGFERILETSIALAVAAIPEGLPVIATLALAAGIRRMTAAKALVRRLSAVETLGCATVICTDKTGTLTENKMLVTDIILDRHHLLISGQGYEPEGELTSHHSDLSLSDPLVTDLLASIRLCNDARLENHEVEGWHIHGDPTEGSLITVALKLGLNEIELSDSFPRVAEIPFDLDRKRMSTLHSKPDFGHVLHLKGSPENVLAICSRYRTADGDKELTAEIRDRFLAQNNKLAQKGLRVLAVATKEIEQVPDLLDPLAVEKDLSFLGLIGMSDRPKINVAEAIATCHEAGIRLIMLTGDQPETAKAIAVELGIIKAGGDEKFIVSGSELAQLSEEQIKVMIAQVSVLARVTPEMKLDIVKRLQAAGQIVAMTGDGVNDAPALRQSNIGIAMGLAGTDMAREASDLVITDDNFATIVKAIKQGRIIYENIHRAVGYLLTASLTSVIAIALGLLANNGLFLEPLQLLYLNLIMHVFPGLGIVLQKNSGNVMACPPRKPEEKLLNSYEQIQILSRSAMIGTVSLLAIIVNQRHCQSATSTVALATLSLSLILQSWSWLRMGNFSAEQAGRPNLPMLGSTAINLLMLAAAVYLPPLQRVLNTESLNTAQVLVVLGAAAFTYLVSMPLARLGKTSS
ncbi:calcium-transporting P-type ATPase, PMR1-type [soil metagenome]